MADAGFGITARLKPSAPRLGVVRALKRSLAATNDALRRSPGADPVVEELVRAVYRLYLGRDPGDGELATRQAEFRGGMPAATFLEGVRCSDEAARFTLAAQAEAAAPTPAEPSAEELEGLITGLYLGFLGRRPEVGVMADWERAARDGVSFVEMARQVRDSEEAARVAQSGRLAFSTKAAQTIIGALYRLAHGRSGSVEELEPWVSDLAAGRSLGDCAAEITLQAKAASSLAAPGSGDPAADGAFVLDAYRLVAGRLPTPREIEAQEHRLRLQGLRPEGLMMELFRARDAASPSRTARAAAPEAVARVGTGQSFSPSDWRRALASPPPACIAPARLALPAGEDLLVSVICDLGALQGDAEVEVAAIAAQNIFDTRCELLLVSPWGVALPLGVRELVDARPNVRLLVSEAPLSGPAAVNMAARAAAGRYLTRATGEDLRRGDALEVQAAVLGALDLVDVVYHEVLYSFDPTASFETAARAGLRSMLPPATAAALYQINVARHAPMWRAALLQELGPWDESFGEAADYDFWVRCVEAGRTFLKLDEPLSTVLRFPRSGSEICADSERVRAAHARALLSPLMLQPFSTFAEQVATVSGAAATDAANRYELAQEALCSLQCHPRAPGVS